ncbi:hypothetical protein ACFRAO_36435 [Streptomyces sp. NPDC056656]|uniref:hypothetical protein n=1 Tax=Streptomyces sp. NPDC056656 TaxID=3345895 RepID=UPI00368193A6
MRTRSVPFIRRAAARRLMADLGIDHPPSRLPGEFQVEDVHREELARLIEDQLRESVARHRRPQDTARFLRPGQSPGHSRNPLGLGETMKRCSLPARAARNTVMMEALADLPPIVISDLVGISPVTANRWARLAGDSWSDYLAARQT